MKITSTEKALKRKNWTMEDFKNSEDILDRTVWFIATLSPHNLWKGYEALNQREDEVRKETIEDFRLDFHKRIDEVNDGLEAEYGKSNQYTPNYEGIIEDLISLRLSQGGAKNGI